MTTNLLIPSSARTSPPRSAPVLVALNPYNAWVDLMCGDGWDNTNCRNELGYRWNCGATCPESMKYGSETLGAFAGGAEAMGGTGLLASLGIRGGLKHKTLVGLLKSMAASGDGTLIGDTNALGYKLLTGSCSFSGDTEVLMADGTTKPIKDIAPGDEVLATDPETGEKGTRTVTHLWAHEDELFKLRLSDGSQITTTEDHPFWNQTDQQWQQAQDLDTGDLLLAASGTTLAAAGIAWPLMRSGTAYTLAVADLRTYYVFAGTTAVLVHNCGDLVGDAARFPNAHVLNEHVNVSDAQLVQMAQATGVKSRFLDLQTAQQVVDYGLAGNKGKIDRWLRGGGVGNLEINGRFGANNPIGVVARADGSISPSSNAYTIVLQRAQGHSGGYHVYTSYPR